MPLYDACIAKTWALDANSADCFIIFISKSDLNILISSKIDEGSIGDVVIARLIKSSTSLDKFWIKCTCLQSSRSPSKFGIKSLRE